MDGVTNKMFGYYTYDDWGRQVIRHTELHMATLFYVTLEMMVNSTAQVHKVVVYRDIDEILGIIQHTWRNKDHTAEIETASTPQSNNAETHHVHSLDSFGTTDSNMFANTETTLNSSCQAVRMISFNIWNLNEPWKKRLQMLSDQIEREKPDIIGFQEVRYDFSRYQRTHPRDEFKSESARAEAMQGNTSNTRN